ncbi:ABC transporter ATP-binding protein [Ornithinimicrobium pekingense]|uniref:ABC transporter n=1 Tax=Ornithinimicrobium pekingense TaxID=384677 RepID=A0ABQ2F8P8_9MICO|nr:ABC transporter ATP-binding protein [Ornithinimicrobium pekingense]GGK72787.1 ABC transporter [Ornithinimicrobium pekingense]
MSLSSLFRTEGDRGQMTGSTTVDPGGAQHAVTVVDVAKQFGAVQALDRVSLTMEAGEFLAVLGPSGCGKTTLLRCLAGFERIDAGRIALGGRAVALPGIHLPPHRRHVTVVPQEGALFPHLSVADNVGFGLDGSGTGRRGARGARRAGRVEECLEMVGLAGMGARMPHELSGGQQQRVALARALAPRPPLVLLDEPFSALDASLRTELRADVRTALREAGATAILVTHDQGEALSMADRVAVMCDGRIRQVGTPEEVYARPEDAWVATFVGEADLVELPHGQGGPGSVATGLGPVLMTQGRADASHLVVRPEQVRLVPETSTDAPEWAVATTVRSVDFHGHDALVTLGLPDGGVARARTGATPPHPGERVLAWVEGSCRAVPSGDA